MGNADSTAKEITGNANALILVASKEEKSLAIQVADTLGSTPQKGLMVVKKYGTEIVEAVMRLKNELSSSVQFKNFSEMIRSGLTCEEATTLYQTRNYLKTANPIDTAFNILDLTQLAKIAHHFDDFRTADEEKQSELAKHFLQTYGARGSFREYVNTVIRRSQELMISDLESLLEANDEYVDGDIHEMHFPDCGLDEDREVLEDAFEETTPKTDWEGNE